LEIDWTMSDMRELLRANDPVLLSAVGALLDGAGIPHLLLDQNMSIMEGSLGIIARRVLVHDEDMRTARRVMEDAGLAHELRPDTEVTEDAALGGRIRLRQLRKGHRFGHDAILLAAATQAGTGEQVIDLGAGVGAAGIALAARLTGARVTLAEIDSRLVELAEENIRLNKLTDRVNAVQVDAGASPWALAAAGLETGAAAGVMMNPPFNDPAVHRASPDAARARAHVAQADTLATWIGAAQRLLMPGGTLTMIWRADGVEELLAALGGAFGTISVIPVLPKPQAPAIRVLVRAVKGGQAPLATLPPLTLNDANNKPTAAAEAALREGAALPFGAS
jgi:tRNA1(Val) A37 N6-methylase TrmN6